MARTLANIPDTQAPSSDYPKGRILDQDNTQNPPIPGTPIIEALYGDIVQFFHKLLGLAGITENNLPDNETNGYQFLAALDDYVSDKLPSITGKADKVTGATNGNFAGLDASGNLTDSGHKHADYDAAGAASSAQGAAESYTDTRLQGGVVSATNILSANITLTDTDSYLYLALEDWNWYNVIIPNAVSANKGNKIYVNYVGPSGTGGNIQTVDSTVVKSISALVANEKFILQSNGTTWDVVNDWAVGTAAGTVCAGNDDRVVGAVQTGDSRLTDAREIKDIAGVTLHTKIVEIGDWVPGTSPTISIAHSITSGQSKIRTVEVIIIPDSGAAVKPKKLDSSKQADGTGNGGFDWDDTNINLYRTSATEFTGSDYDATSYNRGYMTIQYIS